jgi:nudix-type nucleoside diphosphatase (YffH/AdpP family)
MMNDTQPDLQILENRVLHDGFGTLRKVRATDGELELDQEVFDSGDAVAVLLYHPERRVVLFVEQIRIATALNGNRSGRLLEVCAGRTEGGDPEDTARREVQEETGFDVTDLEAVGCVYMSPGVHTQWLYLYAASYAGATRSGAGGGLAEESEKLEMIERSYDEARAMLHQGRVRDAKTMLLLQWAELRGILD